MPLNRADQKYLSRIRTTDQAYKQDLSKVSFHYYRLRMGL